ncbi:methyltransferase domain-containing protein [Sinorhizobium fredii]|uniref:methyltransferase domain-containing protein n=1 Tax=Rhizobium fredii TaxID=380 RepID=UPI0004B82043|nr:methyltransferase domain-containing protein [Sinorhizobium fredii]
MSIEDLTHDRVWEAYYGELGRNFMRSTQKRIHWICSKVQGKKVLDIGCSSGIVPILLGREGRVVLGIDSSRKVIEQAQEHLSHETETTRESVKFVEADFLTVDPKDHDPFDTIVISEVLEHLVRPQDMLDAAVKFLKPDGHIIVTVPFGINDFIDHKRTFYLTEIHDLLMRNFNVSALEFLGSWIGLVAVRPENEQLQGSRASIPSEDVKQLERSFYELERAIRDELATKKDELSRLNDRLKKTAEAAEIVAAEKLNLEESLRQKEDRERHLLSERKKLADELAGEKLKLEESIQQKEGRERELLSEREKLADELAQLRDTTTTSKADKERIGRLEADLRRSQQLLTRSDQLRVAAETRANNSKNTLSYQLGAALIRATNSWSGLASFPKEALRIHKEGKRRQAAKQKELEGGIKKKERALEVASATRPHKLKRVDSHRLRIAGIMDEFTVHSYEPECALLQLHPESWREQLAEFNPDLLFIESAWKGLDGLWQGKISNADSEILEIIAWCRDKNTPSLFWNKEDPVHFSTFIPIAKCVDYVFTTDIDCIPKYKAAVGHERVYLLPFAAQPFIHNPIELHDRKDAFNFAGSYYLRYPERQRDFSALIEAVGSLRPVEIYDRNFDNPHPHYTFPERYAPMILGRLPFSEIDKAYKGYRYGINMNTIKQSQTMFARRVFELLASNTVVVSNFSRGVRLLFGDLVISSDNATEIRHRLESICESEVGYRKFRLLGLRKIMSEHTYADRLYYIRSILSGQTQPRKQPAVVVFSVAKTPEEYALHIKNFERQQYRSKRLVVWKRYADKPPADVDGVVEFTNKGDCIKYIEEIEKDALVGLFHSEDYYGAEYLTDLQLAQRYSYAIAFGKVSRYQEKNGDLTLHADAHQYRATDKLFARSALVRASGITTDWIDKAIADPAGATVLLQEMLATDEFHYIEGGAHLAEFRRSEVEDLAIADQGALLADQIIPIAQGLGVAANPIRQKSGELPELSPVQLHEMIPRAGGVELRLNGGKLHLRSKLQNDKHVYLYCRREFDRHELNLVLNSQFELVSEGPLELKTVFEFRDRNGVKISHQMNKAGGRHSLAIPENCTTVRFGLRVQGTGEANIGAVVFADQIERPAALAVRTPYLVLSKQYPAYDDLYRYGFLHSRLRAYKKEGLVSEVFRISKDPFGYREFEGIDVATGDAELLRSTLEAGQVKHLLVHLLDEHMWNVLRDYLHRIKVTIWVHGSEIQVWQRRTFDFERVGNEETARQKRLSDKRKALWKRVFSESNDNVEFVFVSTYLLEQAQQDIGISLDKTKAHVIHNFIDSSIFEYKEKLDESRGKILSIRPYANRIYANDLTASAILELSKRKIFNKLTFHLYGDGELFDETTAPLRSFENVRIERRFLFQSGIAEIHKRFGIFLSPTRMDTQGVSRDEAMSSGLVPITTNVACIPEFVDESCGVIVPAEDYVAMADAIERLYSDPAYFAKLSKAASLRVRSQSGYEMTIQREISLIQRV